MGIFSSEKINSLYWIGRYVGRTRTTLKLFMRSFDSMIDGDENQYRAFCRSIGVPDEYVGKADFLRKYPFDQSSPFSIISSINHAFDNAVVMRESLGSDTLSYLQMVLYDLRSAELNEEQIMIYMQNAVDHILAFWGCLDDMVDDETIRNIIKLGKRAENLDLDLRREQPSSVLLRDYMRLESRISKCALNYDIAVNDTLGPMLHQDKVDYENALRLLHKLLKF